MLRARVHARLLSGGARVSTVCACALLTRSVQHKLLASGALDHTGYKIAILVDYGAMVRIGVRRSSFRAAPPAAVPAGRARRAATVALVDGAATDGYTAASRSAGAGVECAAPDAAAAATAASAAVDSGRKTFNTKPLAVIWGLWPSTTPDNTVIVDDHRRSFVCNMQNGE